MQRPWLTSGMPLKKATKRRRSEDDVAWSVKDARRRTVSRVPPATTWLNTEASAESDKAV